MNFLMNVVFPTISLFRYGSVVIIIYINLISMSMSSFLYCES